MQWVDNIEDLRRCGSDLVVAGSAAAIVRPFAGGFAWFIKPTPASFHWDADESVAKDAAWEAVYRSTR